MELKRKDIELTKKLRSKKALIPVITALALAGCGGESHAQSSESIPSTPTPAKTKEIPPKSSKPTQGYDVSYPNETNLPKPGAFAIVGLNGINAATFNSYFQRQMAWAKKSTGETGSPEVPKVSIYVHTANPGPTVPDWPTSGKNTEGNCNGSNSPACAFQYGENLAEKDVAHEANAKASTVWLDVEGVEDDYTWQTPQTSPMYKFLNATVLEGMTQGFKNSGDTIGIYSGTGDWSNTIGETPSGSDLDGLPDWILGATNQSEAEANCHAQGFTGKIVIAQIAGPTLDKDIPC